jgi:DNA-binding transcriptional LysR family regulator
LRAGHVDVALIFRYDESPPEDNDIRLVHLLGDPTYLLTNNGATGLADHRDSTWIAGCERCRAHLLEDCARTGFAPHIAYTTDDMVLMQAFVAAGMGVTNPGLAALAQGARYHCHRRSPRPCGASTPLPSARPQIRRRLPPCSVRFIAAL